MIRRTLIVAAASGVLFVAGCRHHCCLNDPGRRPNPYQPPAPNSPFLLPPAGVPTTPGSTSPGGSGVVPSVAPMGVDPRNYPPPFDPSTPGATDPLKKPAPEVLLPEPLPGGSSSRSSSPGDPGYGVLGGPSRPQTPEPPVAGKGDSPTGVPGFARVKDGLASGRKPTLDGFEALKRAGYRTAIYLHPAGTDVSAVRDVVEKRGLKFVAIEAAPERLSDAVARFNAAVGEKANQPAYVFDDDGVRTGALWYLHFRTAETMNDDAARVRAKPLGLTDQGDEAKAFALATQRYLETR